jgi:hypothetical protein
MDAAVMKPVDRDALERAIAMRKERTRNERRRDGKTQIERMLDDRPWREVGEFAAYCCQMRSLELRPWQYPPCWVGPKDTNPEHAPAIALLKRLLANNLSRFEPDPVGAVAAIEARSHGELPPAA